MFFSGAQKKIGGVSSQRKGQVHMLRETDFYATEVARAEVLATSLTCLSLVFWAHAVEGDN